MDRRLDYRLWVSRDVVRDPVGGKGLTCQETPEFIIEEEGDFDLLVRT